jgi:hypothetical protein
LRTLVIQGPHEGALVLPHLRQREVLLERLRHALGVLLPEVVLQGQEPGLAVLRRDLVLRSEGLERRADLRSVQHPLAGDLLDVALPEAVEGERPAHGQGPAAVPGGVLVDRALGVAGQALGPHEPGLVERRRELGLLSLELLVPLVHRGVVDDQPLGLEEPRQVCCGRGVQDVGWEPLVEWGGGDQELLVLPGEPAEGDLEEPLGDGQGPDRVVDRILPLRLRERQGAGEAGADRPLAQVLVEQVLHDRGQAA